MSGWEIYISPYWAGVISTIAALIAASVIWSVIASVKKSQKNKKDED